MSFRLLLAMDEAKARAFRDHVERWCQTNKVGNIKQGRKCVIPDPEQAGGALMDPLVERVFKILRKKGAPPHWSGGQAGVLISLMRGHQPASITAFGELLREARDPVINSMQDVRDIVDEEFRNPEFLLAMFHVLAPRLWDLKAHEIETLLKPSGSPATVPTARNMTFSMRVYSRN